ncbi:MAG: zinc-binding dehydrogenase, partial [Longimicrobiales bacterium]|nr:zinc-binding dehydrogenase [Longimicrobiales bacterium]
LPANLPLLKGCSIVGVFWGSFDRRQPRESRQNNRELLEMYVRGEIEPEVSKTYPLERAAEALRTLADREALGKVVVTVR